MNIIILFAFLTVSCISHSMEAHHLPEGHAHVKRRHAVHTNGHGHHSLVHLQEEKKRGMALYEEDKYEAALPLLMRSVSLGGAIHKEALAICFLEREDFKSAAKFYIEAAWDESELGVDGDCTEFVRINSAKALELLRSENRAGAIDLLSKVLRGGI